MTDHLTENARLRAALTRLLAPFEGDPCRYDHHGYCQAHFIEDDCCVAEARAALATPAPDAVQEAAMVPEIAALIEAAKALHRDMLERAQLKIDTISGDQYRIVNSGRTAWADFDAAIRAIAGDRT